ncbi:hypothetical protein J23TS9_10560 [Paenibacillus sp. J23TS9]|uniref:hypothetical protein n=1 Tax=Paenibacillus sp. J23TS9 TaxID=2807193 RepID=UPI001B0D7252|nr:hypothetical protein [Paenibacillus sp. J23TS9]GIP25926.1 hypothetical protein J23TS9_10560 [Paenibacillus sp. J23TS9]
MPVLTTEIIANVTQTTSRGYSQYTLILVNNCGFTANVYLEGFSVVGTKELFAQETITLLPNGAVIRNYPAFFDFAQFIFYVSMNNVTVQMFAVNENNAYIKIPISPTDSRRITSDFRNNIPLTANEQAVISYQRVPDFTLPEQFGAAVYAQGVEIISSLPVRYKLIQGGTVDGSFQYFPTPTTSIPADSTALQVNFTCTTVTGGQVVYEGQTYGASEAYFNALIPFDDNRLANLPEQQILTLVVSAMDGPDQIYVTFRMYEEW